jgi:hypothetical protein
MSCNAAYAITSGISELHDNLSSRSIQGATMILSQVTPLSFHSIGLREVAASEDGNPCLEAYTVRIPGSAERAEILFLGDQDIAGIAWGADPCWLSNVSSAHEAAIRFFREV